MNILMVGAGIFGVTAALEDARWPVPLFYGIVVLMEPAYHAAAADPELLRRLRTDTKAMATSMVAGRADGLAMETWCVIEATAAVTPEQKLELLSTGLAALGTSLGLMEPRLEPSPWPVDVRDEPVRAAKWMRETGGACVSPADGSALASTLEAMGPKEAMATLIARCDAEGPDPLVRGALYEPFERIFNKYSDPLEPELERSSTFWSSYWLVRTRTEVILQALEAVGSQTSGEAAAAARSSLLRLLPHRQVSSGLRSMILVMKANPQETTSEDGIVMSVALERLSAVAVEARLVPAEYHFPGPLSGGPAVAELWLQSRCPRCGPHARARQPTASSCQP